MKKKLQNQRQVLKGLVEYGRSGRYLEAFRSYLTTHTLESSSGHIRSTTDAQFQLQYAIALQHAGLFDIALKAYQNITKEIGMAKAIRQDDSITPDDLVYNAKVHEAVLLERLGQPREAIAILDKIGPPSKRSDARIAAASLESWIDITRLKCALAFADRGTLRSISERCVSEGDWNQKLWGQLFLALLPLVGRKIIKRNQIRSTVEEIENVTAEMDVRDPPATPWLALVAGQEIARRWPSVGENILRPAHQNATALGKFFVIAAVCEQLSICYHRMRRRDESVRLLRRALSAYARCGLLMSEPFASRLFAAGSDLWGQGPATDIFLRSAHLLEPREGLIFSRMCAKYAHKQKCCKYQIFENFVRDWAISRYVGKYRHIERGRETADFLIVHNNKGTILQAKHVGIPGNHIPKQLYLRKLADTYNVAIERYVFVVTTSKHDGWRESMWCAHYTDLVRQLIPNPEISIEVVLEPELQSDVVLDGELFHKYFREMPPN